MRDCQESIILHNTTDAEELTIIVTNGAIQMKGAANIRRLEELKQAIDTVIASLKENIHEEAECKCKRCQEDD